MLYVRVLWYECSGYTRTVSMKVEGKVEAQGGQRGEGGL